MGDFSLQPAAIAATGKGKRQGSSEEVEKLQVAEVNLYYNSKLKLSFFAKTNSSQPVCSISFYRMAR